MSILWNPSNMAQRRANRNIIVITAAPRVGAHGRTRCMTMKSDRPKLLTLGYDLDAWNGYGAKVPITTDISPATNSHILISGISGGGKSFFENALFSKWLLQNRAASTILQITAGGRVSYLRGCPRYYAIKTRCKP